MRRIPHRFHIGRDRGAEKPKEPPSGRIVWRANAVDLFGDDDFAWLKIRDHGKPDAQSRRSARQAIHATNIHRRE
jgi:hypothetical protein